MPPWGDNSNQSDVTDVDDVTSSSTNTHSEATGATAAVAVGAVLTLALFGTRKHLFKRKNKSTKASEEATGAPQTEMATANPIGA